MDATAVEVTGLVARDEVAAGSRSARAAIVLKADGGATYVLRRQGGPAFGDPELEPLVGLTLDVKGFLMVDTLIMREWQIRR